MDQSEKWNPTEWVEAIDRLELELPPVGVRFSSKPIAGFARLDQKMNLCRMLKEAQMGDAFYAGPENHDCTGGLYIMGHDLPYAYTTGEYVAGLQVTDSPMTGRRIYDQIPRLDSDRNIKYVAFAPLAKLDFIPDLLVILSNVDQSEILLRALSYSTGKIWSSRCTGVIGCAWTYMYPYITGEANFVVTGMSMGMKAGKLYPPGWQLISVPRDLLPVLLDNLRRMPLTLPVFRPDGKEFRKNLLIELGLDPNH